MAEESTLRQPEFRAAYLANEQQARVNTGKVACALVATLMPAGVVLDLAGYPEHWHLFLALRLISSALAGLVWFLYRTPFGEKHHRALGLQIPLLPAFFITWMIYSVGDSASWYYAGLNLIVLAVSVVVRWDLLESLLAVAGSC